MDKKQEAQIVLEIAATTELLKMLVEFTRHTAILAGFVPPESCKIAIAIDEAATNIIKHSYGYDKKKRIKINYILYEEGMTIELIHQGAPVIIVNNEQSLEEMVENKSKGGLGVRMMKKIMDRVEYENREGENICRLVKLKKENNN